MTEYGRGCGWGRIFGTEKIIESKIQLDSIPQGGLLRKKASAGRAITIVWTTRVADPGVLLPRGMHRVRQRGVWKQGAGLFDRKLGAHDEGPGVGPLATESSGKKGHTGRDANDTLRGGCSAGLDAKRRV
jgi:hypothetical protein